MIMSRFFCALKKEIYRNYRWL